MMVIGAPLWKAHTMMRRMKFGEQCLPVRGCFETCSLRGSGFQTDRTAALCCRLRLTRRAALARSLRVVASRFSRCIVIVGFLCAAGEPCAGYSLLTHEEIVDILWKDQIQPLLLKRYPAASANQLRKAHAYAYGGSLIQDIGYYPFGNKFFSDLTHYVCTGDFVANLIRESADIDQYAFALGALAHYSSDNTGHPAINHAVALTFPKLRRKYGERVTYEQNPKAHIQTEFGFDITQVAKHRYTSDSYHDFIGFEVSKPALERAFLKTYGLRLEDVLGHMDLSIGTFRHAVSGVIPEMTRAALTAYHPEIVRDATNFSEGRFLYNLSRTQYETEWGKEYRRPGFFTRVLGLFVRWAPKIGFLDALAFKLPSPQTEDMYIKSINRTLEDYQKLLQRVGEGDLRFPNLDCDTGQPAARGEYALSDRTYARLLEALIKNNQKNVSPELRADILAFYSDPSPPGRRRRPVGERTARELGALRAGPQSAVALLARKSLLAPPFKLQSPKAKAA